MIKVSLLLTTYNRAHFIERCLASINNQTYKDYEAIVIDDGSKDETERNVNRFISLSRNHRIKYFKQEHLGRSLSLINAHSIAKGEYIGWVDSDDYLHRSCLQKAAAYLDRNQSAGLVYTNYFETDFKGEVSGIGRKCNVPYSKEKLLEYFMVFHFRLFRNELYQKFKGIDATLETCMDFDLALKFSEVTEIHKIQEFLYYYQILTYDSISKTKQAQQKQDFKTAIEKAKARRLVISTTTTARI